MLPLSFQLDWGRCCPLHTIELNAYWVCVIYVDAIMPQFKSQAKINRKENIKEINNQWGQPQAQCTRLSNPTTAKLFRNCSCLQMSIKRQQLVSQMTNASLFQILEISFEDYIFASEYWRCPVAGGQMQNLGLEFINFDGMERLECDTDFF